MTCCSLFLAGCGPKLNETKEIVLPSEGAYAKVYEIKQQSSEQKVTLDLAMTGDPVDVFVLREADVPTDVMGTEPEKKKLEATALLTRRGVNTEKATVTIPANTKVTILIMLGTAANSKTEGSLKLTN